MYTLQTCTDLYLAYPSVPTVLLRSLLGCFELLSAKHAPPPRATRSQVPIEVWESIIDLVRGATSQPRRPRPANYIFGERPLAEEISAAKAAKKDILSCSLVCRSWVPRCRWHLLETVIIRSKADLDGLARVLGACHILCSRVQSLILDGIDTTDQSWILLVPIRLPVGSMSVTSLTFRRVDLTCAHPNLSQSFSLRFGVLEDLYFDRVRYSRYAQLTRIAASTNTEFFETLDCVLSDLKNGADAGTFSPYGSELAIISLVTTWEDLKLMSTAWQVRSSVLSDVYIYFHSLPSEVPLDDVHVWDGFVQLYLQLCANHPAWDRVKVSIQWIDDFTVVLRRGQSRQISFDQRITT